MLSFFQLITLPNKAERKEIAEENYRVFGIPYVFGWLDGTLIKYMPSGGESCQDCHVDDCKSFKTFNNSIFVSLDCKIDASKYICRKGYPALNVMAMCDHLKRFRFISVEYGGSAHDSKVYNESVLPSLLEAAFDPEDPLVIGGKKLQILDLFSLILN